MARHWANCECIPMTSSALLCSQRKFCVQATCCRKAVVARAEGEAVAKVRIFTNTHPETKSSCSLQAVPVIP